MRGRVGEWVSGASRWGDSQGLAEVGCARFFSSFISGGVPMASRDAWTEGLNLCLIEN